MWAFSQFYGRRLSLGRSPFPWMGSDPIQYKVAVICANPHTKDVDPYTSITNTHNP